MSNEADSADNGSRIEPGAVPQKAANASKPGAYGLALRLLPPEIPKGGSVQVEVFITGYGFIDGPKILFYPPPNFLDTKASKWTYDFGLLPDGRAGFGTTERPIRSEAGTILILSGAGLQAEQWASPSLFFDITSRPHTSARIYQIATEVKNPKAPVELTLKSHRKVPPGIHNLQFYLTYFNGQEWKIDGKSTDLTVLSRYKQYELLYWLVGTIVAIAGVVAAVVASG